ncbi:hypothetical protein C8R43DRAFT_1143058 [Mycena crocata]|nr:hypothetical protein C8R43DRAFT_1143058 [Mycena crocata]
MPAIRSNKPAIVPASCTQRKIVCRLSSPLLPDTILPSINSVATEEEKTTRLSEEEDERAILNDQLCQLQVLKDEKPGDDLVQQEFKFLLEDYEERFGRFILDSDNAEWHRRKEVDMRRLVELRQQIAYASIARNYDAVAEYFNAVHDFKTEFDVVFAPRDGLQAKFAAKHRALDMYDDLMDRVNGDILRAAEVSRQRWTFSIPNPFIPDDERHLDFHRHLQQRNYEFQNGLSIPRASASTWKFIFFVPLSFPRLKDTDIFSGIGRVLREDIRQEFRKAVQRARLPKVAPRAIPAGVFYGN